MMKKPLSQFVLLCVTLFALCATAGAAEITDSGTCGDNLTWTLDRDGVLTISGAGEMDYWDYPDYPPWYEKRNDIVTAVMDSGVTSISYGAFEDCANLTSVQIPNSMTNIGYFAFSGCVSLTSITIPASVISFGYSPFAYCESLTSIFVDADNQSYASVDGVLFKKNGKTLTAYPPGKTGAYAIPDGVAAIDDFAFRECANLTSVTIPDSVTSIGEFAFCRCASLTSVTIPDSVSNIGVAAFYECAGMTSVTISNRVTNIGFAAFEGCAKLTSVTIPDSVSVIEWDAFQGCDSLTDVYYGGSAAQWKEACYWRDRPFSKLKSVNVHYHSKDIGVGITLTDESGETVDANGQTGDTEETKKDAFQDGAEFKASFSAVAPDASSGLVAASVFIVFYDRDGLMVDLISKEIDLSDPFNLLFVLDLRIPEGAKTLKFLMLGDNLEPLRAVRLIESSADDGA